MASDEDFADVAVNRHGHDAGRCQRPGYCGAGADGYTNPQTPLPTVSPLCCSRMAAFGNRAGILL